MAQPLDLSVRVQLGASTSVGAATTGSGYNWVRQQLRTATTGCGNTWVRLQLGAATVRLQLGAATGGCDNNWVRQQLEAAKSGRGCLAKKILHFLWQRETSLHH